MIIQLVSFPVYARLTLDKCDERVKIIVKILNETSADFVMFSDSILRDPSYLKIIKRLVHNKSVTALLEFKVKPGVKGNQMYLFQNGDFTYSGHQLFSSPEEASSWCDAVIDISTNKYEDFRRQFVVGKKRFLIVQCGENNILKGSTGTAEFRIKNRPDVEKQYEDILNNVDIVLNPVHTRWGRFGNFLTRIRKFSENGRYCFSCAQMEGSQLESARKNPSHNTTHVAMFNKELVTPVFTNKDEDYLLQTFEIV